MSEKFLNPLDPENFVSGGGLWDGKVVTIIESKTEVERLSYGDGSPVIDGQTGEQSIRNVWAVVGIAEDDERERKETYSIGGLIPTPDGEGFTKPDGTPGTLHKNSEAAKFAAGLQEGGYDLNNLFDADTGKTSVSKLVGAQIRFKAEPRLDKDGKVKKNKKGYDQNRFFPTEYIGHKDGVGTTTAAVASEDTDFAVETVTEILTEAGKTLTRAEVVRALNKKLNGDTRRTSVVTLVMKPEFHVDRPWTLDGVNLSL